FWPIALTIALFLIVESYNGISFDDDTDFLTIVVLTLAIASLALFRDPPKSAFAVALAFTVIWLYPTDGNDSERLRSFFGVHKIFESDDGRYRILMHGSTIHGAQMIATESGEPVTGPPVPITYYHDSSAITQVIRAVRERKHGPMRVAVIGLGTGSLACRIAS